MPEVLLGKQNLHNSIVKERVREYYNAAAVATAAGEEKKKRREEKRSKLVAYYCLLPLLEFHRRRCLCSSFLPWLVNSKVLISAASFVNFS
jgi:hypothetical protein